jgi:hypothetical protein
MKTVDHILFVEMRPAICSWFAHDRYEQYLQIRARASRYGTISVYSGTTMFVQLTCAEKGLFGVYKATHTHTHTVGL